MRKIFPFLKTKRFEKTEEYLRYLSSFEPIKKKLYLSPRDFFFSPTRYFYNLCGSDVQKAVEILLRHSNVGKRNVSIKVISSPHPDELETNSHTLQPITGVTADNPGKTYFLDPSHITIWIDSNCDKYTRGSVLVHEVAHIYSTLNNISFISYNMLEEKEQLTDLLTIFLGFGKLILKRYVWEERKDNLLFVTTTTHKLGYLKLKEMTYAQKWIKRFLKQNQNKIMITCPNKKCQQQLRLPKTISRLEVTCPKCGTKFYYPLRKNKNER